MKKIILMSSVAVMALGTSIAHAETVTTKTVVKQQNLAGVRTIDFSSFDINHDGTLSMNEVGHRLFYIFDTDGNESIDNIEFSNKNVMTIIPMKKETVVMVDMNDDGLTDESSYTYETFIETSGLIAFDNRIDGLSAKEFIGEGYESLDDDQDKLINLEEWKEAYLESRRPLSAEPERYNY